MEEPGPSWAIPSMLSFTYRLEDLHSQASGHPGPYFSCKQVQGSKKSPKQRQMS